MKHYIVTTDDVVQIRRKHLVRAESMDAARLETELVNGRYLIFEEKEQETLDGEFVSAEEITADEGQAIAMSATKVNVGGGEK